MADIDEKAFVRKFVSPDGMEILVGKSAAANDVLTFKIADQSDFWLHVSGESGSHVVVRNPARLEQLPRDTLRYAAALAARYSKAKNAPKVTVHVSRVKEVKKKRGQPPGEVLLSRYRSVRVEPLREEAEG